MSWYEETNRETAKGARPPHSSQSDRESSERAPVLVDRSTGALGPKWRWLPWLETRLAGLILGRPESTWSSKISVYSWMSTGYKLCNFWWCQVWRVPMNSQSADCPQVRPNTLDSFAACQLPLPYRHPDMHSVMLQPQILGKAFEVESTTELLVTCSMYRWRTSNQKLISNPHFLMKIITSFSPHSTALSSPCMSAGLWKAITRIVEKQKGPTWSAGNSFQQRRCAAWKVKVFYVCPCNLCQETIS